MRLPLRALGLALGAGLLAGSAGAAALGGRLQASAEMGEAVYSGSDGVQVLSPQALLKADWDQRTELSVRYDVDAVSAASFNYARSKTHADGMHAVGSCKSCHSPVDALSGASVNYGELRRAVAVQAQRRIGESRARVQWYQSDEHDYHAGTLRLGLDRDLAGRDATLSVEVERGSDRVGSSLDPGFQQRRDNFKGSVALTQLLTPKSELRLLADSAQEQGYLADPYSFVFVDSLGSTSVPIAASSPGQRQRWDLGATYKLALQPRSSLELGWRYYQDDWGVHAHTLSASWAGQWGDWVLEPEYRFYTQTAADFFLNDYTQAQAYMTRDLKLAAFSSHWLGVDLRGPLGRWLAMDLRYGRYMRQDGLDYSHYFSDGPVSADTWQLSLSLP
jgi:hypothetical protein